MAFRNSISYAVFCLKKKNDPLTRDTGGSDSGKRIDDNPYFRSAESAAISEFLASVIEATAADVGNVQLFDSTDRVFRIASKIGWMVINLRNCPIKQQFS